MISLVLGGARSGKSAVAERRTESLSCGGPVFYLATAVPTAQSDPEWDARVEAHRKRRPKHWQTVECSHVEDLSTTLHRLKGTVLIDSLGTWVASIEGFAVDVSSLCAELGRRESISYHTVVVSEEVGLGVHPSSLSGRQFRDVLGTVNQKVAALATEVLFVLAGRVMALGEPGGNELAGVWETGEQTE